eukprot:COSAG02_NODE_49935_length_323_cov_1.879464_1_plen_54_part_10
MITTTTNNNKQQQARMDLKKELVAGRTLLVRYASRTRNSAQQREWRKLEVHQGP